LSALCRALAPAQVRVSFSAQHALPFRIEVPSQQGLRCYHGISADAAAEAALSDVSPPERSLVARAIEPEGEGPYADALREWIERVSPANEPARPALRLVR
jgi:hypothetical protein